jgi:hypothetical protein
MRKVIVLLTMLFAFTYFSVAQTGASGSTDQSSGAQTGNADKASDTHAAHKKGGMGSTLTGCLSGPNDEGVYVLKSGKRSVEVGGSDELSKHVGHQVRLHGSWAKSGSDIGEKEASAGPEKKEEKGERHFKVASIDHISDTCTAGASETGEAGGHHHKKGSSSGSSGTSQPSTPPKE